MPFLTYPPKMTVRTENYFVVERECYFQLFIDIQFLRRLSDYCQCTDDSVGVEILGSYLNEEWGVYGEFENMSEKNFTRYKFKTVQKNYGRDLASHDVEKIANLLNILNHLV